MQESLCVAAQPAGTRGRRPQRGEAARVSGMRQGLSQGWFLELDRVFNRDCKFVFGLRGSYSLYEPKRLINLISGGQPEEPHRDSLRPEHNRVRVL